METAESQVIHTGGNHDCGGCCPYLVYVEEGKARKIEPYSAPDHRACARCYAFPSVVHHKDRLLFPLKRTGTRGEGKFTEISWDEALEEVAARSKRIRNKYGPSCTMCLISSGSRGHLHSGMSIMRLMNMTGGFTNRWGSVSNESNAFSSLVTYGTFNTGNSRDDLLNSRLIVAWGWNPLGTSQGTGTQYYLSRAKEAGTRIICVDPKYTDTAATLADEWIPIRPGTDTAMLISMAYVMIKEKLLNEDFLRKYTIGFEKFSSYVLGEEDGIAKTPSWAEHITGVKVGIIESLAREYAVTKPAALMAGWAPGRTAFGEQYVRTAQTLAAMTGNIGISGGSSPGLGRLPGLQIVASASRGLCLPVDKNSVEPDLGGSIKAEIVDRDIYNHYRIHTSNVWDAVLKGKSGGYPADIKMLYIACVNPLNQWPNTNVGIEAFKKLEFIVIHEQFMTTTARFADIILPVTTHWERDDYYRSWGVQSLTPYYIYANKVVAPPAEVKTDFEICCELAQKLGAEGYREKSEEEWLKSLISEPWDTSRDIPNYDDFKKEGIAYPKLPKPVIAFREQIEDLKPFPTPSGKIEIYSELLAQMGKTDLPPIPKYIPNWEGREDALSKKYPFQLITPHPKLRCHSGFDNIRWLQELEPQVVLINYGDASMKGIRDGDKVRVFNSRGETVLIAKVTQRIMPGVVSISEGAWFNPDEQGIDHAGCANVLTKDKPSPGGAVTSNTALVQIERG
ncbi:molybdopterin-dependent oxidoreductase [Chloroflexota bacterium]